MMPEALASAAAAQDRCPFVDVPSYQAPHLCLTPLSPDVPGEGSEIPGRFLKLPGFLPLDYPNCSKPYYPVLRGLCRAPRALPVRLTG